MENILKLTNGLKQRGIMIIIPLVLLLAGYFVYSHFTGHGNKLPGNMYTTIKDPSVNTHTDFIIAILDVPYRYEDGIPVNYWLSRIKDSLNFSVAQFYGETDTRGSGRFGLYGKSLSRDQKDNMSSIMKDVSDAGLRGLFGRVSLEKFCYGQRLEYEISEKGNRTENYGFCYQNIMQGTYANDEDRTVLHVKPGINSPGMLCKSIYENYQHTDLYWFVQEDAGKWNVKPVMKIDPALVKSAPMQPVVKIYVTNYAGNTIKVVTINARNFGEDYEGGYTDKYTFFENEADLSVSGDYSESGLGYKRPENYWEWRDSEVDFKVEWPGKTEVWFDKMRVDDVVADKLLYGEYDDIIIDEVKTFANVPGYYAFYADELVYSNASCTKYVYEKMRSVSGFEPKLTFATTNYLSILGLKNYTNEGFGKLLSEVKPDYFSNDAHEIPNQFPENVKHPTGSNINFINAMSPEAYNEILQIRFGHKNLVRRNTDKPPDLPVQGSFVYQVNLARSNRDTYSPETRFFMQPQMHGWLLTDNPIAPTAIKGLREPMNSEIEAQGMLAIAHGADGLFWYLFQGYGHPDPPPAPGGPYDEDVQTNDFYGAFGLLTPPASNPTPRYRNMYGEPKWDYISAMNKKILSWKPYLDAVRFDSGYSVHHEGANHKYINNIISIDPGNSEVNNCAEFNNPGEDCPRERYWEMGFFYPDPAQASNANDKSKYFLMVNRRCVPKGGGYAGDYRRLKIQFKSTELRGSAKWQIIRLDESNTVVATFDAAGNPEVDCGIFEPGEGRLYRLIPVIR
jgi:hypothetical protein